MMGLLIIVDSPHLIEVGAKKRLWWSARAVQTRVGVPTIPIDVALTGVAMGRWVAVTKEDAAARPAAVTALLTAGYAKYLAAATLRDAAAELPSRRQHTTTQYPKEI